VTFLHVYGVVNHLQPQLHLPRFLKDAERKARRALLPSANDELIKAIVECAINTRTEKKLTIDVKSKLKKYKNRLRALVNPKIRFKSKSKLLVQEGGFKVPLLVSVL